RHRRLRLAIVVALLFLLLTGAATATYLLLRGDVNIGFQGRNFVTLLVANPNGPGLRAIARCAAGSPSCGIFEPAWSPDGTQIAFARGRDGLPNGRSDMSLFVAAADGGGAKRL